MALYTPVSKRSAGGGSTERPSRYVPVSARKATTPTPTETEVKKPGLLSRGISKVSSFLSGLRKPEPYATIPVAGQAPTTPTEPLMTPLPKPSLFSNVPAPVAPSLDINAGMQKLGSFFGTDKPMIQPGSDLEKLAQQGTRAKQELDTRIQGYAKPVADFILGAGKGVEELVSPVTGDRERNFGDVVNILPALSRMFLNIPLHFAEPIEEKLYGQTGGEVRLPSFNDEKIVARGVQTDYETRLNAGATPRQAFWQSALGLGLDLSVLVPMSFSIAKMGVLRSNPSLLLEQVKFDRAKLREWIATGKPIDKDLQEAFKVLPSQQKADLVRGLISEIPSPNASTLGKILGVDKEEAQRIFDLVMKPKPAEAPLALPGEVKPPTEKPTVSNAKSGELIKITDKKTGMSEEKILVRTNDDGSLVVSRTDMRWPTRVDPTKFDIEYTGKQTPMSKSGETFGEIAKREAAEQQVTKSYVPVADRPAAPVAQTTAPVAPTVEKPVDSGITVQKGETPIDIVETNEKGVETGETKSIVYRTSKNGAQEVDVYLNNPESPNAGQGGAPQGKVWLETMPLEKAQTKFQTTDPKILAERIVNPHQGYNYQTEKYEDTAVSFSVGQEVQAINSKGQVRLSGPIVSVRPDGVIIRDKSTGLPMLARTAVFKVQPTGNIQPPTQEAKVKQSVKDLPKPIKQIAKETGIKEPNVRRILGVGTKEGKFERVDKGVYRLRVDGQDLAYIEVGSAMDVLPRLASEGFKSDMIFLDIPYNTPAVKGGNRGAKYELVSVSEFGTVLDSIKEIARTPNTPVIHMFSQAKSGLTAMTKYNDLFLAKGFKPVGKGEYQKTYKTGAPVGFPTSKGFMITEPEGILVFTQSGKLDKDIKNLNFKLVRPSGYQTEKPAEMLKEMIEMTTNEGDVVLDPFAGSGVTGAEAVKLGRKPYLVEKSPEVVEKITKPRVEGVVAPSKAPSRLTLKVEDIKAPIKARAAQLIKENLKGRDMRPEFQKQAEAKAKSEIDTKKVEIKGKTFERPPQLVTKTQVKDMMKALGKETVEFEVKEIDGKLYLTYKDAKTDIQLRPSALGLIEGNLKPGQIIEINASDLKETGTGLRAYKGDTVEASLASDLSDGGTNPATNVDEFKQRIEQLNKFGQSYAILRRTGGLSNKAAGVFRHGPGAPKKGIVHLQDSVVLSPKRYMSTLSHELGHALEYTLFGSTNKRTLEVFGEDLSPETYKIIREELKAVTDNMVGKETAQKGAGYYYKNTELLARFLQSMFISPGKLHDLAPTALAKFEANAVRHPIMQEYLEAVYGTIDKGERKTIFLRDMKQTYQKVLGTRVGTMAWNDEMRYRAMKERAKILIEKFVEDKFKGIKDTPEALFRAAESIKVTENGEPVYGTRDFQYAKSDREAAVLINEGYEPVINKATGDMVMELHNGEPFIRFARERYTPETAQKIFEELSPEGQQLIKDFTAAKDEAKDYFNREVIKDVHKINSELEGWVHHYWDDVPFGMGGDRLKTKVAAAKKHRKGAEGYVEDLKMAMTKALTELETAKAYNAFIEDYFARVSKPIAKGQDADQGWVEVQGNVKKGGVGRPIEIKRTIIEDGKSLPAGAVRYQMPTEVYKRFQMIREVATEAGAAIRAMNSINRYWRVNILSHPGSAATNFISGGLQYSTKVLSDFYTEVLTGNLAFGKTRKNIYSMITALTPKGWQNAPDWVYGGDLSNFYGQFGQEKTPGIKVLDKNVDAYADKALKLYGAVERYWKKVITLSEKTSNLNDLNTISKEGLRLPTEEEKTMLDEINSDIDLYAYDYENVPVWMENYQKSPLAQSVKPFAKYPYKFAKHITELAHQAFDGTLPWQERVAKIMSLVTIMGVYAYYRNKQKDEQKTKEVSEEAPSAVSSRGRLYVGTDKEGNEMFTRTAKYPFLNVTEAGLQFAEGNATDGLRIFADMIGSVAPAGELGLAALGFRNEYEKFTPFGVIAGENLASFVPGTRILQDISRFYDPYQRKQKTFLQGFAQFVPTTDEDLQQKLRGEIRTVAVPLEGNIQRKPEEGYRRTTTDMFVRNYKSDVLLGLLAGLYVKRIDPDVANAFIVRKEENEAEKKKAEEKKAYVQSLLK